MNSTTKRNLRTAALAASLALAGCAGPAPRGADGSAKTLPPSAAGGDCAQLAADIVGAEKEQRAALERQQTAWQIVIPFAVAHRYASAQADAGRAADRLEALHDAQARLGCPGAIR